MPNLVILAGLPGCGKSTWAKTFFDLKYAVVSSDQIRRGLAGSLKGAHERGLKPWDIFYNRIEEALTHNVDVIADATFLTSRHRQRAREIATKTGANLHLALFCDWQAAQTRNAERDEDLRVPDDVMTDMMKLYWDTKDVALNRTEAFNGVMLLEGFSVI